MTRVGQSITYPVATSHPAPATSPMHSISNSSAMLTYKVLSYNGRAVRCAAGDIVLQIGVAATIYTFVKLLCNSLLRVLRPGDFAVPAHLWSFFDNCSKHHYPSSATLDFVANVVVYNAIGSETNPSI